MKALLSRTLLCLVALITSPSFATTMLRADLTSLTNSSDMVVRGTVRRIEPRWSGDKLRIVTDVELQVEEVLKGQSRRSLVIVNLGGVIGDIGQKVPGTPEFSEGEEVIVFLEARGDRFRVSGMSQGKYKVERSSDGTSVFAIPPSVSDAVLLDPVTREPVQIDTQPVSFPVFKSKVKNAINLNKRTP
ncbi:MAG: hypothetical protein ACT4TC_08130 [Myxococcaceae bacterium]